MYRTYEMQLAGRPFVVEVGRMAELAGGSVIVRYGDTSLIVTATASEKPRAGIDFFPLSIDFEERFYSVGKIPGGWFRREGRPSEKAILTARLIDRPIRPLFPKDYRNDVVVCATVLSVDQDCSPEIPAMIGANIALAISPIPLKEPTASVNIGLVDGQLIVNPDSKQREITQLSLTVSSTSKKVMMIEAGANEVSDDIMVKAIALAHSENVKIVEFINSIVSKEGKEKMIYTEHVVPEEIVKLVKDTASNQRMEDAVFTDMKQERDLRISAIKDEALAKAIETFGEENLAELTDQINEAVYNYEKQTVRRMILRDHKRPDGRKLDEIRNLSAEVDILPRVHGSALFARGQTQVLTVTTLGTIGEAMKLDGLDDLEVAKRYMHHYNFPSYSVGEARPARSPSRRDIGHGALAEKALLPVIPTEEEFPYAIRLVSEVVSSNGSTSQGSVCGSTLSLMAAGVPIKRPVAGISVGLVTGDNGDDDFVLLTDIQGIEDFFGDMDFKVAGTTEGITAIQLDMKIEGLTPEIIEKSIRQTREARDVILDVMTKAIPEPRKELSPYAPKIAIVQINPDKISEIIGTKGKVINRIIDESGVDKIDTHDDGKIFVAGYDQTAIDKAVEMIKAIAMDPEVGNIYTGTVTKIIEIGCFVEFAPGREGLVHISELEKERVKTVDEVVKVGDTFPVKLLKVDDRGRLNLSRKACL